MKKIVSRIVVVLLVLASCASAQEPDASLWSGSTNPDGSQIVPVVSYDPATGAMTVNTLGMNQTLDSADCSNIAVDDAGMISLLVTGPEPVSNDLTGFTGEVVWNADYFNGKAQLFGVPAGCEFIVPSTISVFTYDTGLTEADFGEVEMAVNYSTGVPGGIIFGGVQFVPEPSSFSLIALSLLSLTFLRRRSR
jgi:hypothetical protein